MVKRRIVRILSLFLILVVCCVFVLNINPQHAHAAVGGTSYPPQYFPILRFDNCYAVNSAGYRYYLPFPFNEFAAPGYNYNSTCSFTNNWFSYSALTQMNSQSGNALFPYSAYNHLSTSVNFADGTGRSFNMFAYEMPFTDALLGEYDIFIGAGGYMFDVEITFDAVFVKTYTGSNGDVYYETVTRPNERAIYHAELVEDEDGTERYIADIAWYINEMLTTAIQTEVPDSQFTQLYQRVPFLKNVNVRIYNVIADPDFNAGTPGLISIRTDCYRLQESAQVPELHPYNMENWFNTLMLKMDNVTQENVTVLYEMPTNWITWLGDTIGGVLNVQLFGTYTIGGLLATIIGVLIFVFFIKVFRG